MMKNRYFILPVVVMLLLASCRNELCYNHFPAADVHFEWEQEWERDYGMQHEANWDSELNGFDYSYLSPGLPEWINYIRYNPGQPAHEQFISIDGGRIVVNDQPGESILFYNGDTDCVILAENGTLSEARATTNTRSRSTILSVTERHPDARTVAPPDMLYASYIQQMPEVKNHELKHLPVTMQPLVFTYHIRYEFDYGDDYIVLARGALGGMAESVYLHSGKSSKETAIILYDCEITGYGCSATVKSFGVPDTYDDFYGRSRYFERSDVNPTAAPSQHDDPAESSATDSPEPLYTLNLEVMMLNGKLKQFNFDITDQLIKQPKGGVIVIKGLKIEDEEGLVESGFSVDVDGWGGHEDHDLPVGVDDSGNSGSGHNPLE